MEQDAATEAIESVPSEHEAHVEAPVYPWWSVWTLWIVVVAVVAACLAEWPKQLWIKPHPVWQRSRGKLAKIGLMAPVLLPIGAVVGAVAFREAGLIESWQLAALLGMGAAIFSAPIYDGTVGLIQLIPKIVRKRAGLSDTIDTPPISAGPKTIAKMAVEEYVAEHEAPGGSCSGCGTALLSGEPDPCDNCKAGE